jgi:hypothetical protein
MFPCFERVKTHDPSQAFLETLGFGLGFPSFGFAHHLVEEVVPAQLATTQLTSAVTSSLKVRAIPAAISKPS